MTSPCPIPAANEVLVRVEAAPINPSDLGLLIAGADMSAATVGGHPGASRRHRAVGRGALTALVGAPRQVASRGQ